MSPAKTDVTARMVKPEKMDPLENQELQENQEPMELMVFQDATEIQDFQELEVRRETKGQTVMSVLREPKELLDQ